MCDWRGFGASRRGTKTRCSKVVVLLVVVVVAVVVVVVVVVVA